MTKRTTTILVLASVVAIFIVIAIIASQFRDIKQEVYVESIEFISPAGVDLLRLSYEDDEVTFVVEARALPENATNRNVTFSSTNSSQVSVVQIEGTNRATVTLLSKDGSARIRATALDASNSYADLDVVDAIMTERSLNYNPTTQTLGPDRGVFQTLSNASIDYVFYKGFGYTITGVTAITGVTGLDNSAVPPAHLEIIGTRILFNELGDFRVNITTASGTQHLNIRVVYFLEVFSMSPSFNFDNYHVGTSNAMDFNLNVRFLDQAVTSFAVNIDVQDSGDNDVTSTFVQSQNQDVVTFVNNATTWGETVTLTFTARYQVGRVLEKEFTLVRGNNVHVFERLREDFADLTVPSIILHNTLSVLPADIPDMLLPNGSMINARTAVLFRDYTQRITQEFNFFGNGHTLNYSNLPRVLGSNPESIVFAATSFISLIRYMDNVVFNMLDINILGNTQVPGIDAPAMSGGLTAIRLCSIAHLGNIDTNYGRSGRVFPLTFNASGLTITAANNGLHLDTLKPSILTDITIRNMFGHAINNYNTPLTINYGVFELSGGPLFHVMHRRIAGGYLMMNEIPNLTHIQSIFGSGTQIIADGIPALGTNGAYLPWIPEMIFQGTLVAENLLYGDEAWMMNSGLSTDILFGPTGLATLSEGLYNSNFGLTLLRSSNRGSSFNFVMLVRIYGVSLSGGVTTFENQGFIIDASGIDGNIANLNNITIVPPFPPPGGEGGFSDGTASFMHGPTTPNLMAPHLTGPNAAGRITSDDDGTGIVIMGTMMDGAPTWLGIEARRV